MSVFVRCKDLRPVLGRYDFLLLLSQHGSMVRYDRRPLDIVHLQHRSFRYLFLRWLDRGYGHHALVTTRSCARAVVWRFVETDKPIATVITIEFRCDFNRWRTKSVIVWICVTTSALFVKLIVHRGLVGGRA
mgnify:CR=1 FL=1